MVLADTIFVSNFLGIQLDREFTKGDHINSVSSKLTSGIYCLEEPVQILPMSGTDDDVLGFNIPTSLVWRAFFK